MIKKAILFIFVGIPGLFAFLFSSMSLTVLLMEGRRTISPEILVFMMLIPVGAVLTLLGVGKLKQWLYVLPFLAFPVSAIFSVLLSSKLNIDTNNEWMLLGFVLGPVIIFYLVRSYYRKSDTRALKGGRED